jgi:serine/threonine protein kinase
MAKERYELEVKIGVGGMGEVWLARDTLLDRPVAVKFLQSVDKEMYRDLFLSEARTLASLQHPNITLIYDAVFDEAANRFYIMMEYVKGQPLSAIIAEHDGPLPFERVLEIAGAVCSALQYAHQKGFVHRDIKPENIIIQPDGALKLTDFGLAALVSILAEQDSDYIVGTPAYMSPEQIAGEALDGRADLYALGVMLFELVTGGRRPFEYDSQQALLTAHIEEEPPSVREFAPAVPVKMERIIARLLAKYPEDRYTSAGELLDAFTAMQARQKFSHGYLDLLTASAKPLVERERELARLNGLWAEVQSTGISRLALVEGGSGIGKTRLVAEFLGNSVVDSGQVAAVGRCDEVGAAYTPYAEILATIFDRGLVKPSTLQNRLNYLIDQIPSLAPLLHLEKPAPSPDNPGRTPGAGLWQTLSQRVPHTADQTPAQTQWEFFNTVLTILTELGPTVIFLDEAHHLDAASVALTRYLVSQRQLALLIVGRGERRGRRTGLGGNPFRRSH